MNGSDWMPDIGERDVPIYLAIAEAIAADIEKGVLESGTRLPPQRVLADRLGIDFTTVSRAYAEARNRNLVEARVGSGTYVRASQRIAPTVAEAGAVDLMVNHPPHIEDAALSHRLWRDAGSLTPDARPESWMRYRPPAGLAHDRAVAARWLVKRLHSVEPDRLLICPGTQGALLVATMLLAERGDAMCVDKLTYPGFILIAQQLGIRLLPVDMDEHGACPQSLARICQAFQPKAFYCMPTLHNPTTITMPLSRRMEIAAVLRAHTLPLIEDDNYWTFLGEQNSEGSDAVPPLSALVPELAYYISGLAKCVTPAVRIAYMSTPDLASAQRAATLLRATVSMASPFGVELATRWLEDGTALAVSEAIREEALLRRSMADRMLGALTNDSHAKAFHLWISLPHAWTRLEMTSQLRGQNILVAESDCFAVAQAPEAIRLSLGGPVNRSDLAQGLERIAHLLAHPPARRD